MAPAPRTVHFSLCKLGPTLSNQDEPRSKVTASNALLTAAAGNQVAAIVADNLTLYGIPVAAGQQPSPATGAPLDFCWRVAVCGVSGTDDVWVAFGTSPDATAAGTRYLCPAGGVYFFTCMAMGEKAAVALV